MEEDKTVTTVLKIIATALCVFIVSMAGCTANRHYQIRMLVESGKASPEGARCAIDSDASDTCKQIMVRDMVNRGR